MQDKNDQHALKFEFIVKAFFYTSGIFITKVNFEPNNLSDIMKYQKGISVTRSTRKLKP